MNPLDLSSCDKEPIHLLGRIQSHGSLLAFDTQSLTLRYISANVRGYFSADIGIQRSSHLRDFLGSTATRFAQDLLKRPFYRRLYPKAICIQNKPHRCYFANAGDYLLVELEEEQRKENHLMDLQRAQENVQALRNIPSLSLLYSTVVHFMKQDFGFDRVMMYVFDEMGDGEVVAEAKEAGLESFLGLKYPASDIPKQARKLYLTNVSRAIRHIADEGIPIEAVGQVAAAPLDLSYSVFRSVSSVHVQYLKNMGVTATHALSLIIEDKLWGMILFHHYESPKHLDFNDRLFAEILALNTAQAIELLIDKQKREENKTGSDLLDKFKQADTNTTLAQVLEHSWPLLKKRFRLQGASLLHGQHPMVHNGEVLSERLIYRLHTTLEQKPSNDRIQHSDALEELLPERSLNEPAGFLRFTITENLGSYLYLWRAEKEQTINWAGNPEKSMEVSEINNRLVLTPRASFALWQEKVRGKSLPWEPAELYFAKKLLEEMVGWKIQQISTRLLSSKALEQEKSSLEELLTKKSEELYRLNLKLREELGENKKYQRELEVAKTVSEQLNKLKSNFISTMSHEIRTPLSGIIGLAQLVMDEEETNSEIRTYGELILESAERLMSTVNRILAVSRIENDSISTSFEVVDMDALLEGLIKPLQALAKEKEQHLVLNIHNKQLNIVTDRHYFSQIFTNIVSNAIKYTRKKGLIEVNVKCLLNQKQQVLQLVVEDNGIGIDTAVLDKIFDPFFTENEVSKIPDNSSGLGLYLVKTYLQYLGGEIKVDSEKGSGSRFHISIPVEQSN